MMSDRGEQEVDRGAGTFRLTSPWNSLAHARAAWAIDANILKFALPETLYWKKVHARRISLSALLSVTLRNAIYLPARSTAQELETISHKRGDILKAK
jgi:hypothetical protein